jgi:hypothetical protein
MVEAAMITGPMAALFHQRDHLKVVGVEVAAIVAGCNKLRGLFQD